MAVGIDCKLIEIESYPGVYDVQLDALGDVATEDSFDTGIFVSLFTDKRAEPSQIARPEDRRGWIGNERTPGFQVGSYLWLFEQSRLTRDVANSIEDASEGALRWMIDDGYAVSVRGAMSLFGSERGSLTLSIIKPDGTVETPLFDLWDLTGITWGVEV